MKLIIKGDVSDRAAICAIWETASIYLYNELRRKMRKPVLLRLRLAASEKPVLNASASACVAEIRRGGARDGTDDAAPRATARCL